MRKLFVLFALIILAFSAFVPMASAQTTPTVSAGCTTLDGAAETGGVYPKNYSYEFLQGELITITVSGFGTFDVTINGGLILDDVSATSVANYSVTADGPVTILVENATADATSRVAFTCLSADESPDYVPGTICHIPPGNPNAAHTITVGLPAVDAHLAHGDTEGPCPAGVDTRYDNEDLGITIFIIFATGEIQVYGNCDDEGECEEVTNVPITVLIDFSLIVVYPDGSDDEGNDGEFEDVEDPADNGYELPDSAPDDGLTVVIFYLHPDPNDSSVGVFQINVYQNGVLVDDSILLFITTEGIIIIWTDQNIWVVRLEESLEDEDD
jgi:hypothetical protein